MDKRLILAEYGKQLWTRDLARTIRKVVVELMDSMSGGDVLVLDAKGVDVFDFSFANELFGKTVMSLGGEYSGRFVVVENLTEYTKENLIKAMESMGLVIVERQGRNLELLGKVNATDRSTFEAVVAAKGVVTSAGLKDKLGLNLNAMNERLAKLVGLGLVRREKVASSAGREQYEYRVMG